MEYMTIQNLQKYNWNCLIIVIFINLQYVLVDGMHYLLPEDIGVIVSNIFNELIYWLS